MPQQPGSQWAWRLAEARPEPVLNWDPYEGHGTEAQIADLSSGDGKEQPGPRFIKAGCYCGRVRGGSLVRLAPHELRAGALHKLVSDKPKSLQPRPWGLHRNSRGENRSCGQIEGSRRSLRTCRIGVQPLDVFSLGRY